MLYNALLWYQGLSVVAVFVTLVILFPKWKNRIHAYLFLFGVALMVNNLGYFIEMMAKNYTDALWATKITYLGKLFISAGLLFFMTEYTETPLSTYTKRMIAILHGIIGAFVFTSDAHSFYYESIVFTEEGLFPHNIYEHGFMYYIYIMMVIAYIAFATLVALRKFLHERRRKRKMQTIIIIACGAVTGLGFIIYSLGIAGGYDPTAISYMVCFVLMIVATAKYDKLEALDLVKNYIADNMTEGIIAIDTEGEIIYHNNVSEKIYPALKNRDESVIDELNDSIDLGEVICLKKKYYKAERTALSTERKIFGMLYVIDDITIEYNHNKELKLRSITDGMTGLFNRTETVRRIDEAIDGKSLLSLIMIDIDDFKKVNDSFGHDIGDNVIKGIAKILLDLAQLDPTLTPGRWGGEEFMLVLPGASTESACLTAEMIRKDFANTEFEFAGKRTVSLGVSTFSAGDNTDTLSKRVDEALYISKQEGKNRVTFK